MNIEKAISVANQLANPTDAEALKNTIYQLQKENLDYKAKLEECKSKLKVYQKWSDTIASTRTLPLWCDIEFWGVVSRFVFLSSYVFEMAAPVMRSAVLKLSKQ